jgi:hypothetical protein
MAVRGLVVLAILAALMGAPSITFGATNNLTSAHVSPASGSVDTIFTLTVDYDGKFAATGVTATVGGRVLTMTRFSGSAYEGTWAASGTLPAGTWLPLFVATVESGTPPTLTGTAVTIYGALPPATPVPTGGGGGGGGSQPDGEQGGDLDPGEVVAPGPGTTPVAVPADGGDADEPAPGSVTATPAPGESPWGAPGESPGGAPGGASDGGPGAGSDDGAPAGGSGSGTLPGSSPGGSTGDDNEPGAAPADPSADPGPEGAGAIVPAAGESERDDEEAGRLAEDRLLGTVLVIGLSGVAAVAILGTALLVLGRRRSGGDDEAATRESAAASTEAVLHQRTLRRAKVRLDDDPIVAAMGIEDEPPRPPPAAG